MIYVESTFICKFWKCQQNFDLYPLLIPSLSLIFGSDVTISHVLNNNIESIHICKFWKFWQNFDRYLLSWSKYILHGLANEEAIISIQNCQVFTPGKNSIIILKLKLSFKHGVWYQDSLGVEFFFFGTRFAGCGFLRGRSLEWSWCKNRSVDQNST